MITFLPDPSFSMSAAFLDNKRLWKQVLEADQIYRIIGGEVSHHAQHPAVLMWEGYEEALLQYRDHVMYEWMERRLSSPPSIRLYQMQGIKSPPWLGDDRIHKSHQAALLAKNFDHYRKFGWHQEGVEPMDLTKKPLPYFWPTKQSV